MRKVHIQKTIYQVPFRGRNSTYTSTPLLVVPGHFPPKMHGYQPCSRPLKIEPRHKWQQRTVTPRCLGRARVSCTAISYSGFDTFTFSSLTTVQQCIVMSTFLSISPASLDAVTFAQFEFHR